MPRFMDIDGGTPIAAAADVRAAIGVTTGVHVSGVDTTGVSDSLATLQGFIDDASPGDTIYLPGGKLKISAPLVINKPLVIRGGGGMFTASNQGGTFPGAGGTSIVTSSATANGLSITATGVVIEDIAVVNTRSNASAPVAGTGIYFGGYTSNFRLSRVTVAGFYDCVRTDGRFGNMDSCMILDPVRYGILISETDRPETPAIDYDFGDYGISNCQIAMYGRTADADAAVRWESGAGLRFTGNKIVAGTGPGAEFIGDFRYGIDIVPLPSVAIGEVSIVGGAISTCSVACVRMGQSSDNNDSIVAGVVISGVVFQGNEGVAMLIGARTPLQKYNIRDITVTGCSFKGVTGGIVAYNCHGLNIGTNMWTKATYTSPLITLAGSSANGNDNGTSTHQVDIARQNVIDTVQDISVTVVNDKRRMANSGSLDGFVEYHYRRNVYANTTGWKTLYTIEPHIYGGAGFIDVTLSGQDFGVTYFTKRIRRSFLKNNNTDGGAITIATSGTDENIGATTYVGLQVVDAGSGKIAVQAAMLSGGATLWGVIEVNVSGRVQKFSIGAGI